MSNNTIDARLLRQMFLAGAKNLELNKEWINDLNEDDADDSVGGEGGSESFGSYHGDSLQGDLFRFPARSQR